MTHAPRRDVPRGNRYTGVAPRTAEVGPMRPCLSPAPIVHCGIIFLIVVGLVLFVALTGHSVITNIRSRIAATGSSRATLPTCVLPFAVVVTDGVVGARLGLPLDEHITPLLHRLAVNAASNHAVAVDVVPGDPTDDGEEPSPVSNVYNV